MAKTITILTFVLVLLGLVILSSAGIVEGHKKFNSPYYHVTHQLLYGVLPGAFLFFLLSRINYKFWRKASLPILIGTIGLLVLVFVPQFGYDFQGAQRWVDFGLFQFQPSEPLKLALVIYLAAWFSGHQVGLNRRGASSAAASAPFLIVLGFIGLLLISQPDMGTLIIVTFIAIAMYFFAGAKLTHFLAMLVFFVILLGALAVFEPYRFDRIKTFFNPNLDRRGTSYHINQALIGIGSGGLFGKGFGQSQQKLFAYLPEPVGDSIFAIYLEELGFVGATILILLFLGLVLVLTQIARFAPDSFGALLVLGIAIWITGQTFVNIGAISGLIPLTGIPLPFISYGSSALVSLMAGLGIVTNIAKHSKKV